MSWVEQWHAERKARLARMSPPKVVEPSVKVESVNVAPVYQAHDAGWDSMWHHDLVTMRPRVRDVSIKDIQSAVALEFRVRVKDILANRRQADIILPRHVAMYLAKMLTPRSLTEIGNRFGGRDHTTIMHAVKKIEAQCETDDELFAAVDRLRRRLT
jgi:hypothetical protein